jgi:hypothetical protein
MSKLYALWGERSLSYISQGGKVIVHPNPVDLKRLFPGTQVVEFRGTYDPDLTIYLRHVRGMEGVQFPVKESDLR